MDQERWLSVTGYESLYEVSDQGRVRSLPRVTRTGPWPGGIRKAVTIPSGHLRVDLWRESRRRAARIHQLVLEAFVGPCPVGQEVRHLDGDPANNRLSNLQYGTRSDQRMDDVRNGVHVNTRKTRCPADHPYDKTNTKVTVEGYRRCRTCLRDQQRARRQQA